MLCDLGLDFQYIAMRLGLAARVAVDDTVGAGEVMVLVE
jgi:hypothetical protein